MKVIDQLKKFWSKYDVTEILAYDVPIGAATYHPICFFEAINNNKNNYMYVNPSRRLADGRQGKSDQRLLKHHQFQVTLTLDPIKIKDIYLESLKFLGINGDIKFIENNWSSQSIGAYGKGWEVWCNLSEITQFTFFQKIGNIPVTKVTTELAYGMERIVSVINNKPINQCQWDNNKTYGEMRQQEEKYMTNLYSKNQLYSKDDLIYHMNLCNMLISKNNYYGAYEILMFVLYIFNCLEANNCIGPMEHKEYMIQTQNIAENITKLYLQTANTIDIKN